MHFICCFSVPWFPQCLLNGSELLAEWKFINSPPQIFRSILNLPGALRGRSPFDYASGTCANELVPLLENKALICVDGRYV